MQKILLFSILNFFLFQNPVFATIQSLPKDIVLKETPQKRTFKQKVLNYIVQRKMQRFMAPKSFLGASRDSSARPCVQIQLKNGSVLSGTIVSLDEKAITYKLCGQPQTETHHINLTDVSSMTDAEGRVIFNNEKKIIQRVGRLTKGDHAATISMLSILLIGISIALMLLFLLVGPMDGPNLLSLLVFGILFFGGILTGLISGIYALIQMKKNPPQKVNSKLKAISGTILSGLLALVMLVVAFKNP
jgi:hypothetical protein